ncbi:MAG: YafY family transcriptional regulator [Lachnospiraceae bacterium]|nr:YafY family transcriptional regulator [Lachnospiraceae bacterium]
MKIERLVSIIMILLEKKKVSAETLANTFEVSKRTIYRDIDSICMAGIPIRATSGVGGGFEIMPNFKIDKNVFTENDLATLLTGLSNLASIIRGDDIIHAMCKVKNFIPAEQANAIALKTGQIYIDVSPWTTNPFVKDYLEKIKLALDENRLLSFSYINRQGNAILRTVEPCQLVFKTNSWYFYGFCHLRNDYRLFKLSRILDLNVCDETYIPKDFPSPILNADEISNSLKIYITLRIHKSLLERMLDYCSIKQVSPDGDSHYIIHVPFIDRDYYYDMLLCFGEKCECLEPVQVREKLAKKASEIAAMYQG